MRDGFLFRLLLRISIRRLPILQIFIPRPGDFSFNTDPTGCRDYIVCIDRISPTQGETGMTKSPAIRKLLAGFLLMTGSVTQAFSQAPSPETMLVDKLAPKMDDVNITMPED